MGPSCMGISPLDPGTPANSAGTCHPCVDGSRYPQAKRIHCNPSATVTASACGPLRRWRTGANPAFAPTNWAPKAQWQGGKLGAVWILGCQAGCLDSGRLNTSPAWLQASGPYLAVNSVDRWEHADVAAGQPVKLLTRRRQPVGACRSHLLSTQHPRLLTEEPCTQTLLRPGTRGKRKGGKGGEGSSPAKRHEKDCASETTIRLMLACLSTGWGSTRRILRCNLWSPVPLRCPCSPGREEDTQGAWELSCKR